MHGNGDSDASRGGEDIAIQVSAALRRITHVVDSHSRYLANRYGLTGPQLTLLGNLSQDGGIPVSELARAIHLSQATVTGILDRLERRSLVRRQRSSRDKRQVLVSLTPAGAQMCSQAPPPLKETLSHQLARLADWERTQILSSVQRVAAMLEEGHWGLASAGGATAAETQPVRPGGAESRKPTADAGDGPAEGNRRIGQGRDS